MYVAVQGHDASLTRLGPIDYISLNATLYYNGAGSWAVIAKYTDDLWAQAKINGFGITVDWGGFFTFGGKCESPGYQFSVPGSQGASVTTISESGEFIVLAGATYEGLIANRIAYPNPAASWSSQASGSSDSQTGPLETVIKHFVNVNAGPGAISARRIPILSVAGDAARGGSVSYTAKFSDGVDLNLMDIIRNIVATGGPMGVSVADNGVGGLVFDVFVPRDLTKTAYFSPATGTLVSAALSLQDPTCTNALVQGQTEFVEVNGTGSGSYWTVVEEFVQQNSETVHSNLVQAANDAISQGAQGPQLAVTAVDVPALTFGRDYYLGDTVSAQIRPGDVYSDIVSQVDLMADGQQQPSIQAIPTIGYASDPGAADPGFGEQLLRKVRRLERRLNQQRG